MLVVVFFAVMITYMLLGMIALAESAPLGILNYNFMPLSNIVSAAVYLIASYYHDHQMLWAFKKMHDE